MLQSLVIYTCTVFNPFPRQDATVTSVPGPCISQCHPLIDTLLAASKQETIRNNLKVINKDITLLYFS